MFSLGSFSAPKDWVRGTKSNSEVGELGESLQFSAAASECLTIHAFFLGVAKILLAVFKD